MEEELERIFGRHIDLITRKAVEESRNPVRKQSLLGSTEKIYGA